MKRTNYKIFTVILLAAALFSSCGVNRMVKNYEEGVRFEPATNPLENHGGEVAAEVTGTISEGYFQRNAIIEFTPVLKYDGGEQELPSVTLRGTKTTTEGQMINQDSSTNFDMNNVIEYQPGMEESELVIRGKLYKEGREDRATELPERKVADGVVITSQRIDEEAMYTSFAAHGYELETIVTQKANLYFDYMRTNVNMRLPLNRDEQAQQKIENLKEFLSRGWDIRSINVNAWASPEGEIALNERLSEDRASTGERFLRNLIREVEREMDGELNLPELNVQARGEDFDNFLTALENSDLPDKEAIANVINSQLEPAARERRMRDMTVIYEEVEEILAPLRRAEFVVEAYEPKRTAEEIADLATSNPSELSLSELLYAATLTSELETRLEIYESAQELHPRDYRGFNNAGAVLLEMNETDRAAQALERANQLEPNNGHVQNNLGIVAAINDDYENAGSLFKAAREQGVDVKYNLGILMIPQGEYKSAISSLSGLSCAYNLALAQLMVGNADDALKTLDCAPEKANVYYLKAVIGARQNNDSMVFDNLSQAISMDASYIQTAASDAEFIQYRSVQGFIDLID